MPHPRRAVPAATALALLLSGCGIPNPYQQATTIATATRSTRPVSQSASPAPDEDDGQPAPARSDHPGKTAGATVYSALARFASLYVNWTAAQLSQRARQLAEISSGQARAQALTLAARAGALGRYQVTNSGTVVAIAAGKGQESGRWAVITDELTNGTGPYLGLPATSHVTWATLQHQPTGYVISSWYPAS